MSASDTVPLTPLVQSGTIGTMTLPVPMMLGDFTIPLSPDKWNQVIELQLPDGKKVFLFLISLNKIIKFIFSDDY